LPVVLAVVLLGLGACTEPPASEQPTEVERNVRVLTLGKTNLTEFFEISGPVQPVSGSDISSEEAGRVAVITRDKGERIEKGEVLVELDRRLLAAEVAAARADLELQEYNNQQTQRLHEAQKVSRFEMLTAESQYEQAKARYELARLRYQRAAIKAPFSGLVTDRHVDPGELVAPGVMVARVIDPYTLKLVGSLTEREVTWVKVGAAASVILDGYDWPVSGEVAWVGFEADPTTGKFEVEINIDNSDLRLRSGVVGRARILKTEHADVIAIPRDAVLQERGVTSVFVVQADTAALRPVTLGADQGLMVVVESGLREGEKLVVRGQRDLVDGAKVRITEEATAADGSNGNDPLEIRGTRSQRATWQEEEDDA
jgi:RND family efflux transporter MFP subunit